MMKKRWILPVLALWLALTLGCDQPGTQTQEESNLEKTETVMAKESPKETPTPAPTPAATPVKDMAAPQETPAVTGDLPAALAAFAKQQGRTENWVIGMSQCNLGEPWRVQMNKDIQEAAAKYPNIDVIFKDAQNDTLRQRSQLEEFTGDQVDLILVSPKESAPLTPVVAEAYDKGIPVIVLDRDLLGDKFTVFIGADNYKIGKAAGEFVNKTLNGKGRVVELKGLMTTVPGHKRHNGFMEGIQGSEIEIIFDADMKWLEPEARKEMESALARFDDIDLVYAHNDPGAHGAYLAAMAAGRQDDIMFVGIDGLPHEGQAYVRKGILDATFQYPTGGEEALETAAKIFMGQEVPKEIVLNSREYTKENVAQGGRVLIFE